jgi:periplasmic divalent cation tolerance protein
MTYTPDTGLIRVSTATETKGAAVDLARRAVEAKLAAGAQVIGPVTSMFWHLGEFGTGEEWQLLLQTHRSRYAALETLLLEHHPWDNPELIAVPIVEAAAGYQAWARETLQVESPA